MRGTLRSVSWDLDEFDRTLQSLSAGSRAGYHRDVLAFQKFCDVSPFRNGTEPSRPGDVTRAWIRSYVAHRSNDGCSSSTIARSLSVLRRYFSWALLTERTEHDPTTGISAPRGSRRLPRVLSAEELDRLIDVEPHTAWDLRDRAIVELLYGSGLRVAELCGMNPGSVECQRLSVTVVGKGAKERMVPISAPAAQAWNRWIDARPGCLADGGDMLAAFVNRRGRRITPRDVRRVIDLR